MAVLTPQGQYRVITHGPDGKALYLAPAPADAPPAWVRSWREAATYLTRDLALRAGEAARQHEPTRTVGVVQRFQDWPKKRAAQEAS